MDFLSPFHSKNSALGYSKLHSNVFTSELYSLDQGVNLILRFCEQFQIVHKEHMVDHRALLCSTFIPYWYFGEQGREVLMRWWTTWVRKNHLGICLFLSSDFLDCCRINQLTNVPYCMSWNSQDSPLVRTSSLTLWPNNEVPCHKLKVDPWLYRVIFDY